jgi:hypothetical protein
VENRSQNIGYPQQLKKLGKISMAQYVG